MQETSSDEMAQFKAFFNEWFLRDCSKKTKNGKKSKAKDGKVMTTYATYGYKKDPKDKNHYIIDQDVAPIIKEIFADNWGIRSQDILSAALLTLVEVDGSSLLWLPALLTDDTFRQKITSQIKDTNTPRMGGIVIWGSVLVTTMIFWLITSLWPGTEKFNFLSRNQTWLPLFTLIVGSIVGLIDDWRQVKAEENIRKAGLPFSQRLLIVILLALVGAYWFYFKLELTTITLPFVGLIHLGWLIIPLFILVMIALFSSGVIDGLDGLSGGVMAIIFAAYTVIAFSQNQIDLAAFCGTVTGGLLAFLWFNIPPARFYMTETGILGLTTALTVVVFLTDSVFTLPTIS
jgi:UDP-N-acetylmuramyl pentapeptide phosphotransferase/UDP-N-acetylglucosamine-1-phosphate transferase